MTTRPTRLLLESLDDRTLPAVTVYDLTTSGAQVATGGFIASQVNTRPVAEFTEFVRIQGLLTEQGYNTTASQYQFNESSSGDFSRALTLGQVPTVMVDGTAYREFVLNANQLFLTPRLSVDQVRIFLAGSSNLTGYNTSTGTLAGNNPVFDLDANGDVSLIVRAQQVNGRFGTMTLLVQDAAFAGASDDTFVYLYSKMGERLGALASGGAESWAVHPSSELPPPPPPPPPPPGPGTSSLSGYVFVDSNENGVKDELESWLSGVTIHLTGQNDLGETVELTTITDANGFYSFESLRAGTYTLSEVQPETGNGQDLMDGLDYLGSLGGDNSVNDVFSSIILENDQHGTDYNFTELYFE
ncbi:MAG: hypothetical protein L0241_22595 [Planctomycetia bacterium]|nr:hypothetical protein [Planctomycetia bacterium]